MIERLEDISEFSDEELLSLRICQLPLKIEGTWIEACIEELYSELKSKGLSFSPPCYLADEWLTPDQEPIIGIPFFLAHPRLIKLERKIMLEVEGGDKETCLKLLRHECGHAINYAYKLYRRKTWQKHFGKFNTEYSDTYRYRPFSRKFVHHLDDYYAQYHPDEDFAETFAVWLNPDIDWMRQYQGWKALEKLKYVDKLMQEIKDKEPLVKNPQPYWQAKKIKMTLKNYYKKKRHYYAEEFPDFYDDNLKKIFSLSENSTQDSSKLAWQFIRTYKKEIINTVSHWSGERKYVVSDILDSILLRCRHLKLVLTYPEDITLLKLAVYITNLVVNYIYTGRFRKKI